MSAGEQSHRLIAMALSRETDVVVCRNRARLIAEGLNFDRSMQVRIATAVSEIARNAFRYGKEGTATFSLITDRATIGTPVQWMAVVISDQGPGITALESILAGTYRSTTGMGTGLRGVKRLLDRVEIRTSPAGTTIELRQRLGKGRFAGEEEMRRISALLMAAGSANPLDELAEQNRDLVASIEEIAQQKSALAEVNEELKETNRGVVALYDELETVHRLGRVVASRLDLDSLLSAITDSTTDLSQAECGAFYLCVAGDEGLIRRSVAGRLAANLAEPTPIRLSALIPVDRVGEVMRFEGEEAKPIVTALGWPPHLRGVLMCLVRDSTESLIGALIFGHTDPHNFTERTERILTTVSVQASVGIANARLFRNVQTANEAKSQFLAILSHELRTPLNPVFMLLTAFEEHPDLPAELRADLEVMRRNLLLEARLIDDLLDLTRISEGKLPMSFETLDLHPVLDAVVHTCATDAGRKNIRVELQKNAANHRISGDGARLQQVFWNLLINAIKFSSIGGVITITTANLDPDHVTVSVADRGHGMDAEALERIFRPFEQENAEVSLRFGGLGLGLAISKGILNSHMGQIRAESEGPQRGATMIVTLPVLAAGGRKLPEAVAAAAPASTQSLRILFIDDHDDTRRIMERILTRRGHEVTAVANGAAALEAYRAKPYDLILSDLGLPDMSGHLLMSEIQRIRPIKGVALSGYGMETDVAASLKAGFNAHLTKPLDMQLLDQTIRELGVLRVD